MHSVSGRCFEGIDLRRRYSVVVLCRCPDDAVSERAREHVFLQFVEKKRESMAQPNDGERADEAMDVEEEKPWFPLVDAEVMQQRVFDIAAAPTTIER